MKIIPTIIFILSVPFFCFPQGEFNNWYFGHHCGITFNSGTPVFLPGNPMNVGGNLAEASVSDSSGNLLFFSNGLKVWNRNLWEMPNGLGLLGGEVECQVMAVQDISNPNLYYLFTVHHRPGPTDTLEGSHYSLIDMQLDGGLGDIVPGMKNIPLPMGDSVYNALTATRHQNNRDAWVVVLEHGTETQYLAFLIDSTGLNTTPVVSPSTLKNSIWNSGPGAVAGFMRISPGGQYLFCTDSLTEMCFFNTTTGVVTPQFRFWPGTGNKWGRSPEFSIDSRYVYFTTPTFPFGAVVQYDMINTDSASFMQSQVTVGDSIGWGIQMAPDGKIYVTTGWADRPLHRINNPSAPGTACNFQSNAFDLEGNSHFRCLPQFLEKYKVYIHYSGHCQFDTVYFSSDIWPPPDSLHWDFGDPLSGAANFSNDTTPTHIYSTPGNYTVELFVRHIDKRTDTAWITIQIDQTPQPTLGPDQTMCDGDSVTLDAGFCNQCTFRWDNLLMGQMNIGNEQTFIAYDSGIYAVTVASPYDCPLGRDTVQLAVVTEATVSVEPPSLAICSGDTTDLTLQCNVSTCDFSWTAVGSSPLVTGYSPGTGDSIRQTLFNNDTLDQTVTYTITPANPFCTGIPSDYQVVIHPVPDVWFDPTSLTVCSGQAAIINLYSHVAGATFSWTAVGSSGDVTGFSDGSGTVINQVLQNTGNATEYVTYQVTPTGSEGCIGTPIEYIVTILPVVEATVTPPATVLCSGDTTDILLQCNLTGCTFNWNAVASSPLVTGYSSGTGDSIRQALFNSDIIDQTVTYSIVPSISGCGADTTDYSVLIHPRPPVSVTITASINPVCQGIPVTFTAIPVNGGTNPSNQWQVNGINTGTNNSIFTYYPTTGDQVSCILTSSESCTSGNPATSNPITMSVAEQPAVSFSICFDTITTLNAKPYKLKGGIPLGGTYTGPGVDQINGYFIPALAGLGTKSITNSYTHV